MMPSRDDILRAQANPKRRIIDALMEAYEAPASLLSGMIAQPISGIAGLLATPGGSEKAANAVRKTQEALTYQPRSEAGRSQLQSLGKLVAPLEQATQAIGDAGYAVGGPVGGAIASTLPTAAGMALPIKPGAIAQNLMKPRVLPNEAGMFLGEWARTADKGRLAQAQALEAKGAPREQILNSTGWFKGPEGKWRFEIDDRPARLDMDALPQGKSVFEIADWKLGQMPAYQGMKPGLRIGNPKVSPDDQKRALAWAKENPQEASTVPLSQAFQHGALTDAYGDMNGLQIGRGGGRDYNGLYDESANTMRVGGGVIGNDTRLTALHELQHVVQKQEGFAKGGSPSGMAMDYNNGRARLNFLAKDPDYIAGSKKVDDLWDRVFNKGTLNDQQAVALEAKILAEHPALAESRQIMQSLRGLDETGATGYKRLAGEAEARAVQARRDMSPQERVATPPWQSYDVPWNELIVK